MVSLSYNLHFSCYEWSFIFESFVFSTNCCSIFCLFFHLYVSHFLYMWKKVVLFVMLQTFFPLLFHLLTWVLWHFFPCRKLSHTNYFSGPLQLVLPLVCLQSFHSAFIHVIVCYDSFNGTFIQSSFLIFLASLPFSAYILLPNNTSKKNSNSNSFHLLSTYYMPGVELNTLHTLS